MRVKICGLTRPEGVDAAAEAGASYLGFMFFPPSPRSLSIEVGQALMSRVPKGIAKVAVTVDPDDALADQVSQLPVDFLQLHGHETLQRIDDLRNRTGLKIIKAIGVSSAEDLSQIATYTPAVDQLLIDAKPPKDATRPGGNAISFDWNLLAGRLWDVPWLLAGGLTPDNLAEAVQITGASQLDVSSAVETAPGIKDPAKIHAFMEAARAPAPIQ
ncbi:MAG: phosphoribosylanthranilate isomerase [Pseudomonadota bacterium]